MKAGSGDRRRLRVAGALLMVGALLAGPAYAQEEHVAHPAAQGEADGFWTEPAVISRSIDVALRTIASDDIVVKNGFYPEVGAMVTGSGWLSLGPGYRHWLFNDLALTEGAAAYSWRGYKAVQARFEAPTLVRSRLVLGTQYRWRDLTQVTYFGEGPESSESSRSEYRLTSHELSGYAVVRFTPHLSARGRVGWLRRPDIAGPVGHFRRGYPNLSTMFPTDVAVQRGDQPSFLNTDLSVVFDTREYRSHPVRGSLYRASWSNYRERDQGPFTFRRLELEGAQFIPALNDRIVFGLRGWAVLSDVDANRSVPFYLLPTIGGHNTLRGYADYRFHDRNALVMNAEVRAALFAHLDAAVFFDAGNVSTRPRELDLDRTSVGAGLRLHTSRSTLVRIDVAHGREGWQLFCKLSEPLRIARTSARTALAPFVP